MSSYSQPWSWSGCSQPSVNGLFWPQSLWTPCHGRLPHCASRTATNHRKTFVSQDRRKHYQKKLLFNISDVHPLTICGTACTGICTSVSFLTTLFYPFLISPLQCRGRMWHWCWGDHSEVVVVVTSGRVPQRRRASRETGGADRHLNRCKGSVCTPGPVSGWCCPPLLYWTLVSHFPGGQEAWEGRDEEKVEAAVMILCKNINFSHHSPHIIYLKWMDLGCSVVSKVLTR